MRSDWIVDVLADLRSFADANALPLLAEQLDDTALIAAGIFENIHRIWGRKSGVLCADTGPNGQFALFTVNHTCDDDTWATFTEENRRDLILIAHYFNEKALEFESDRQPEQQQALSPREIDTMTLLAIGYSRAQVANSLSISEHTLRVYIESARYKLGALNTNHAVARAMSCGLIVV